MSKPAQHLIIHGKTLEGQRFRPSDWAERLAGVLSQFRPEGSVHSPLSYSPYAMPCRVDGIPCVSIDPRLRQIEPLAWKFACDFADSNHLLTTSDSDAAEPAPDEGSAAA